MLITENVVKAEHAYRSQAARNHYRAANERRGRIARTAATAAAFVATAFVAASPSTPAAASHETATESWIATNWESLEPTWEPNWVLLEAILDRGAHGGSNQEPVTRTSGPQ